MHANMRRQESKYIAIDFKKVTLTTTAHVMYKCSYFELFYTHGGGSINMLSEALIVRIAGHLSLPFRQTCCFQRFRHFFRIHCFRNKQHMCAHCFDSLFFEPEELRANFHVDLKSMNSVLLWSGKVHEQLPGGIIIKLRHDIARGLLPTGRWQSDLSISCLGLRDFSSRKGRNWN